MKRSATVCAFSLVEVTLSLGVISFCLVALFGLLPIGLKSNQAAVEQTAANGIISNVIADLRATPAVSGTTNLGGTTYTREFNIGIPNDPTKAGSGPMSIYLSSNGKITDSNSAPLTALSADSRYRLKVSFISSGTTPAAGASKAATLANLQVSWPAAIDPDQIQPNGKVQTFVALDRN